MKKFAAFLLTAFSVMTITAQSTDQVLQWSNTSSDSEGMDYKSAVNYCQKLNENGFSDWRLPKVDELKSLLINYQGKCPISEKTGKLAESDYQTECMGLMAEGNKLGQEETSGLWSSSAVSDNSDKVWIVEITDGILTSIEKDETFSKVRCIRDSSGNKAEQIQFHCNFRNPNRVCGVSDLSSDKVKNAGWQPALRHL